MEQLLLDVASPSEEAPVRALARHLPDFPATRYQGSKRKILRELATAFSTLRFKSALDLFSGSGMVTLLLRHLGKQVDSNDYQLFNQAVAGLFLRLITKSVNVIDYRAELKNLLERDGPNHRRLVSENYRGVFFSDEENAQIDRFCQNLTGTDPTRTNLYVYAIGQSLLKKRPYNLFHRANLNMRQREVSRSFGNAATWGQTIYEHAVKAIDELTRFPFRATPSSGSVLGHNTLDLSRFSAKYDLVYLDPPYLNSKGVGVDYSDFYGFLEGLCDYNLFAEGDNAYAHKPILRKPSSWNSPESALRELDEICRRWARSIVFLSYRSDGRPTPAEAREVLSQSGRSVEIRSCGEYKYVLSRSRSSEELFLISFP